MATLKLNQILAVAKGIQNRAENFFTQTMRDLAKPELLNGLSRTYEPRKEGDETYPPENKRVQLHVEGELKKLTALLTEQLDTMASRDRTNCEAFADISIDGVVLVPHVPVTHLLSLEKKLNDLLTLVRKAPTLDPADDWQKDDALGVWKTAPTQTFKTRKNTVWVEVAAATREHAAQVKEKSNDEIVGVWTQIKHSSALPVDRVEQLIARVEKLQRAVKYAREQANGTPVIELKTGAAVLGYIFG